MKRIREHRARLRRALAAGMVIALPLGAAACGDDDNDDPEIIDESPGDEQQTDGPMLPDDNTTDGTTDDGTTDEGSDQGYDY